MIKKTNTLLASAVAAGVLMMAAQGAAAADKAPAANAAASAIEQRMKMMEEQMQMLKAELARTRAEAAKPSATSAKLEDLEAKIAKAEKHEETHHDLLFFRGGFAKMSHARGTASQNVELLESNNNPRDIGDGWDVGAGFDHRLTDNLWGLTDIAAVDGEVMFEYKNFGRGTNTLTTVLGETTVNQITQFTLTASPKIKFNNMGNFRPWIIPFGLGIHVISPPSNGVTVLNPGLMVGTGAEYKIWQDLYAGVDFRYHFTGDDLKGKSPLTGNHGVSTDGLTTGAYLGFGF